VVKYISAKLRDKEKAGYSLFCVCALVLFVLIFSWMIENNTSAAREEQFHKYAAVALLRIPRGFYDSDNVSNLVSHLQARVNFTDALANEFALPKFIADYYLFSHFTQLHSPDIYGFCRFVSRNELVLNTDPYTLVGGMSLVVPPFSLMIYSDISKSTHFRTGDRQLVEGRFAQNQYEVNMSIALASANGLSVGDTITLTRDIGQLQVLAFEIVGLYIDNTSRYTPEASLIMPRDERLVAETGNEFLGRVLSAEFFNYDVGTVLDIMRNYTMITAGMHYLNHNILLTASTSYVGLERFLLRPNVAYLNLPVGFDARLMGADEYGYLPVDNPGWEVAIFYLHGEQYLEPFFDALREMYIPEQFAILHSPDMLMFVRHILDRTSEVFTRFTVVVGAVSVVFLSLLVFYILKSRTYDIGVLRCRGMSRTKVSLFFSFEILIVSLLAYITAAVGVVLFFTPLAEALYRWQDAVIGDDPGFRANINWQAINNVRESYEFTATLSVPEFFAGLGVTLGFALLAGFAAAVFIARHEPMKTMTRF